MHRYYTSHVLRKKCCFFLVILFVTVYKVVLTSEYADEIIEFMNSNEKFPSKADRK